MLAREAKELTVSAWVWEKAQLGNSRIHYQTTIAQAVRAVDP